MRPSLLAAGLAALMVSSPGRATDDDLRTIAGMAQHNRVLLVFSPSLRDARLDAQRQAMARFAAGAAARDLVFVQVGDGKVIGAHDDAARLRQRFGTPESHYRTLLIGKDGRVALDLAGPIDGPRLQAAIDAMPMRRDEMRRARAGQGGPAD